MLTVREQARNRVIALRLQALGLGSLGWEESVEGADPIPRNFSDATVLVDTVDDWCAFRGARWTMGRSADFNGIATIVQLTPDHHERRTYHGLGEDSPPEALLQAWLEALGLPAEPKA
ncbi:MAG: hypothetical protein M1272_07810 [Firmicutes bacterium]|nr:hypothetical protein [Bacillota bacterium]